MSALIARPPSLPDGDGGTIVAVHRDKITADVAARLIAGQFPQWAALPVVPVKLNGWDNMTFRLGDELSIRLPSADKYTAQVSKEHRWLPVLAPRLPLPIPEPVAMGRPSDEFPQPWSVYRWIAGEPATADRWEQAPVWVHGDVTGSNLLSADGELRAVIDFGSAAIGDPACDLVMEWTFFTGDSAAVFRRGLHLDEATWARGRGWALWEALREIGGENKGHGDGQDAAHRFGWRHSPRQIVDLVIADHARSAGR
jgi:aminoglycoside phosphotransferase (APT) family kinase protein